MIAFDANDAGNTILQALAAFGFLVAVAIGTVLSLICKPLNDELNAGDRPKNQPVDVNAGDGKTFFI